MPLKHVLFLCIGNSCRSQMAEGFARTYGSDVIAASSAGLAPAGIVSPLTRQIMLEKNIDLGDVLPKPLDPEMLQASGLIINMSGWKCPAPEGVAVEDWKVRDPIGQSEEVFRQVANEIEHLVMRLILRLRAEPAGEPTLPAGFDRTRRRFRQ